MENFKINCVVCGVENDVLQSPAFRELASSAEEKAKKNFESELENLRHLKNTFERRLELASKKEKDLLLELKKRSELELALRLEFQRNLNSERLEIEKQVRELLSTDFDLKIKERDIRLEQLNSQIVDLKRVASQGSVQLQGAAQEVVIKERIAALFPKDEIKDVPKGTRGGDALVVIKNDVREIGAFLVESKRTANWDSKWIPKLREDLLRSKADIAVLVTQAMPKGVSNFKFVDGVWVCDFRNFEALISAVRIQILEVDRIRQEHVKRGEGLSSLHTYLNGSNCRNNIAAYVSTICKSWESIARDEKNFAKSIASRRAELQQIHRFWKMHASDLESHGIVWGEGSIVSTLPQDAPLALRDSNLNVH